MKYKYTCINARTKIARLVEAHVLAGVDVEVVVVVGVVVDAVADIW